MKNLLFLAFILPLCGCQQPWLGSNSVNSGNGQPVNTSGGCPEKPLSSLERKNVKDIALKTNETLQENAQVNASKSVGYTFDAQAGQRLSYRTQDQICVWVFSPSNDLLTNGDLTQTGKYTVQVSAEKGATTFNLEMSLGSLQASSTPSSASTPPSSASTPQPYNSPSPQPQPYNSPKPSISRNSESGFSQQQGQDIIQGWLNSKSQIFAPPFNEQLLSRYTMGPLYQFIAKPDGPMRWLQRENSYYQYRDSRITRVLDFSNSGSQPYMKVRIFEDRTLYSSRGSIDPDQSGQSTNDYIYFFSQDNGVWKIYDYQEAK